MLKRFERFSSQIACIHRAIAKIERDEMQKAGYKGVYAPCLIALRGAPEGLTAAALCKVCEKDKASVSRILAEMEQLGLIGRVGEYPNLYRARLLLTVKGNKAAEYVCKKAISAVAIAGRELSDEERKIFYRCLGSIAQNISKIEKNGLPENID